jgi:type IV secretory pathway VirB2 component (pilin)
MTLTWRVTSLLAVTAVAAALVLLVQTNRAAAGASTNDDATSRSALGSDDRTVSCGEYLAAY